jgi:two-component system sensor histidine kinase KdpD
MSDFSGNQANITGYLAAFGGVALITSLLAPFREHFNTTTSALALLLVVLLIATIFGRRPALVASLLGVLCFNFFFLPPVHTLTIADPQNWVALFAFLAVAVTVGQLSAKVKKRAEEAERLYRELQAAFEKASRAEAFRQGEKLKSALLDAVTHDLKTPLTSIKAAVTMLIEEQQEKAIHVTLEREERSELLDVINEETDRINTFVESMVEMARLEAGETTWRKKQTSVEEIIGNSLQRAETLTARHKIVVKAEENLPLLSVDSKAITEVVYNLLDNAVKYSPPGSAIGISVWRDGDKILFSVEDEGVGIAAENRERVFQKFFRADRRTKGFGMGLAIVHAIIEAHSGKIRIEDGKKGSKFVFELPLKFDE